VILAVLLPVTSRALAQAAQPVGALIATLHLGGDSVQVARLPLHAGQVYRLEITPTTAQIQVRPPTPGAPPLPHIGRPPVDGSIVWAFVARRGNHYIELTNPGIGATAVRVIAEGLPPTAVAAAGAPVHYDSTVFDESFPGPRGTVQLVAGNAYRLEITPPVGDVSIRYAHTPGAPPLVLYPLSDPVAARGGDARLLVPSTTSEYRIDVRTSAIVRVRVILDARETASWVRMAYATRGVPQAGVGLRAVVIGAFPVVPDVNGVPSNVGGVGVDACLALGGPIRGCVLSVSYYSRSGGNNTVAIGVAPRFSTSDRDAPTRVSLSLQLALAGTTGVNEQSYLMGGLGVVLERRFTRTFGMELEGAAFLVNPMVSAAGSEAVLVPRVALGFQYSP
jgi:hypothetical protein